MEMQENGGRISRKHLLNNNNEMDIEKVVEWVKHYKLNHVVQNNNPTGQAKLRKVALPCFCSSFLFFVLAEVSWVLQDYYERGNGNFPAALSMDGRHEVGLFGLYLPVGLIALRFIFCVSDGQGKIHIHCFVCLMDMAKSPFIVLCV